MASVETRKSTPTSKLGKTLVLLSLLAICIAPVYFAWSFWQGFVAIMLGLVAILIGSGVWLGRLRPMCIHRIRGGAEGGECVACDTEIARRLRSRELYEKELDRLQNGRLATEETIRRMDPFQFETMVCNLYRALGYDVKQTRAVGDGGRDAVMTKDGFTELLEVKLQSTKVGRPALQKFHSAMITDDAVLGHFVAPGGFSKHALEFGELNRINTVDIDQLLDLSAKVGWGTAGTEHYTYLCIPCGHYGTAHLDADPACGQCGARIENAVSRWKAEHPASATKKKSTYGYGR